MLWQKHGLRPDEFCEFPLRKQLFFIASEEYYGEQKKRWRDEAERDAANRYGRR